MDDYVIQVHHTPQAVDAAAWDQLLQMQAHASPFMQHAYLLALHASGSAHRATGWDARFVCVTHGGVLTAAAALYIKNHSMGEYVFDWAWANAYRQHGLAYYPKGVVAVPFTPVPGTRLMARDDGARDALLRAIVDLAKDAGLSSLHLLFGSQEDIQAATRAGLMLRHTVQFHWNNRDGGYRDFDEFLTTLSQEKRKKIRQERRKVSEAGVTFRHATGADIALQDWDFFYACYERTYLEHGNAPYLKPDFFHRMAQTMADNWLLFIAERGGKPVASSLIALSSANQGQAKVAYGRYWGALERVDCLHFEACYYQPLAWCIANGYQRFEGGAQGEHKMARALLPVRTSSAHWIDHPQFRDAIENYLDREANGIDNYLDELKSRNPYRLA